MRKYTYRIIELTLNDIGPSLEDQLNVLGAQGWRVVCTLPIGNVVVLVEKRLRK